MVFALATLRFSAQKLRAIGLMVATASSNATEGGGGSPSRFAASVTTSALSAGTSSDRLKTRRPAGAILSHRHEHGLGDIVPMDAAELVSGLDQLARASGTNVVEHGAARAVDAGQTENIDREVVSQADQAFSMSTRIWPRDEVGAAGVSSSTQPPSRLP